MDAPDFLQRSSPTLRKYRVATLLALFLAAYGGSGAGSVLAGPAPAPSAPPPLAFGSEKSCTDLKSGFQSPGVTITGADVRAAAPASGATPALPQHCEITGAIDQRIGVDNLPYAIKFHLRIPIGTAWTGRFVFSGGGGSNGVVGDALTVAGSPTTPLARGDAVLSQDSGHDNVVDNVPEKGGDRAFGFDPQARIDNFYRAHGRAADVAKQIIKAFRGNGPQYSYFAGCSKGGQEAAMVTQRYPEMFDGVVVGDPLLGGPFGPMIRPAFIVQTYADLARSQGRFDRNGLPFLNKTFTDADMAVLKAGVAQQCDGLDGVVDGMSQDFKACTQKFNPATLRCAVGQTSGCLSAAQVGAIQKQMAGLPGDMSWVYDMGLVEGAFRSWWLGPYDAAQTSTYMVGRAVASMYTTPPVAVNATANNGSEPYKFLLEFNLATDIAGIYRTDATFKESSWDLSFATGTDLSKFKGHGGKLMIYHGVADGAFTINQTIDWYEKLSAANGGDARNFARFYPVAGMGHCGGGPATSSFDMLSAVQAWVEKGTVPETVLATAPAGTPWPGRTRPLCTYPKVARYVTGDIEKASSFVCE